jgi:hypothetical protein
VSAAGGEGNGRAASILFLVFVECQPPVLYPLPLFSQALPPSPSAQAGERRAKRLPSPSSREGVPDVLLHDGRHRAVVRSSGKESRHADLG